ncbi:MAG: 16S rRNA (adenine(1518)-N(6)/adenine(1519)-N(6))-dimethyltransferase RsmA [Alphaproteobacteria bacterium]|nr:16S rRNA (adenine(1518)-N(6)/adenine(1519)-N(6))-dimethyltransferase RsmA [Alphaproteobacteria bacterium]
MSFDLPPLREVVAQHDLLARKSLGQHFLLDLNLTQKIVASAGDLTGCTVFEIGPGPGGLTRPLVASPAQKIIAIEKDPRFIEALDDLVAAANGRLEIVGADALTCNLTMLAPAPRVIVANLPYNVGTPLLLGWLKQMEAFRSLTLMFQAEVVDRLVAAPSSKAYGRLSIITQFCCDAKRMMTIPARAFTPPPKINSAVVHLTPRADRPRDVSFEAMERVTTAAFGQRRKMLRSSLRELGGEDLLARANITPNRRAEELTIQEFEMLARVFAAHESFEPPAQN